MLGVWDQNTIKVITFFATITTTAIITIITFITTLTTVTNLVIVDVILVTMCAIIPIISIVEASSVDAGRSGRLGHLEVSGFLVGQLELQLLELLLLALLGGREHTTCRQPKGSASI